MTTTPTTPGPSPDSADVRHQTRPTHTSRFVLSLRTAARFFSPAEHPATQDPRVWRLAVHWLVPMGLICGLLWTSWFSFIWWKFGEIERLRVLPSLAVVLLDVALIGYPMFKGAILTIQHLIESPSPDATPAQRESLHTTLPVLMALLLLVMVKFGLCLSIPTTPVWWPSDWRQAWMWLYPETVRRPLLLAPLWGAWGILMAGSVGRAASHAPAAVAELGRAARPAVILGWFIPLVFVTGSYCSHHGNFMTGVILSFIILAVTFAGSAFAARRLGGQTFSTILAAGQLAQLSFLTGFLAFGPYVFGQ